LNNEVIRQIQTPLETQGQLKGYILTAIPQEGTVEVLKTLKKTLSVLYPMVLMVLFLITRFLAGRSILPVKTITQTTDSINKNNLNERIPLPSNKDEIYALTSSINRLLERIEETLEREKQFTTDASHQLRTPLAVLKGTLEVLIRKPRTEEEYKSKIQASIGEIDRISSITDQLFLLARFDQTSQKLDLQTLDLDIHLDHILQRYRHQISEKELSVNLTKHQSKLVYSDPYYLDLILENILSNAIKYSPSKGKIEIELFQEADMMVCTISDQGIGIKKEDLQNIFNPFFRSNELEHKHIKGNGLGLSIAKKAGDLLGIAVNVSSQIQIGSTFYLKFPTSKV
jgi:signal transduction histidine kinase